MSSPKIHSFTWSDAEDGDSDAPIEGCSDSPMELVEKELHVWVTYPEDRPKRNRKSGRARRKGPKLWAVAIIEALRKQEEFTYEVTLRRIYKKEVRFITVCVTNDPTDQSEEAVVFSFVRPRLERLDPLEKHMSMLAAKRVYDAIAAEWPEASGVLVGERER